MHQGSPSITAIAVAFLRAQANEAGTWTVRDPIASALLPVPLRLLALVARSRRGLALSRRLSLGLLDHIALRTGAIDEAVRRALPIEQLVILGAGLDARVFRMPELAHTRVLEVDHPSTQALKRQQLRDRRPLAREVRFVAVDFASSASGHPLDIALERAGHLTSVPTLWIWEGVLPYLPPAATRTTLEIVRARSAPSSELLVTYATPALARVPDPLKPVIRPAFALLGEPLRGTLEPEAMRRVLEDHQFLLVEDSGSRDWARAHTVRGPAQVGLTIEERLAVAVRS